MHAHGTVRSVLVKTSEHELRRPTEKLCLIVRARVNATVEET